MDSTLTYFAFFQDAEFIGQQALVAATESKDCTHRQRLIHLTLGDHNIDTDIWPWGSEPIYFNGKLVGKTTSASYSPASESVLCWGQVNVDGYGVDGYEVDIAGKMFKAKLCS